MMFTEPSFLLIIYFSHSFTIKKKKHWKSFKKIVLYKIVYFSLFFLSMLLPLSCNKNKS
jgi:hypothetical protein